MVTTLDEQQLKAVEMHALLNSVSHAGKAEVGAVVGKMMGAFPELRSSAKDVSKAVIERVREINSMTLAAQQQLLQEKYPEAVEATEERKVQRKKDEEARSTQLPPLPNAEKGKVVLRLPPEPSGYMTIGHAMAGIINATYRDMYEGELWLRFEDTNPKKVKKAYYESFKDGYNWLGIVWDHEKSVSSDMELLYSNARRLITEGNAYSCSCPADLVKKLRFEGKACEHRGSSVKESLEVWEGMLSRKFKEGEWVIRLKGDMSNLDHSLKGPEPPKGDRLPAPHDRDALRRLAHLRL